MKLFRLCGFKLLIVMCFTVDDFDEDDAEFGSASKKRRTSKSLKLKKPASSRFDNYFHSKCLLSWLSYVSEFRFANIIFFFIFIRVSTAVNTILQKLCTILGLLKDLLLIERLSDSCILQLVRTSITTFLVDNIQLLQLKTIGLVSAVLILLSYLIKGFEW